MFDSLNPTDTGLFVSLNAGDTPVSRALLLLIHLFPARPLRDEASA
jgi:hypothetical protein